MVPTPELMVEMKVGSAVKMTLEMMVFENGAVTNERLCQIW